MTAPDAPEPQGDPEVLSALLKLIGAENFVWSDDGKIHFRRISPAPTPIALDLPGTGIGPFDLEDLFKAIKLGDVASDLLSVVPLHDGIYLTGLEMQAGSTLDTSDVFVSLEWPAASWSPLPSVEFHAPAVSMDISKAGISGEATGIISFAGIDLAASLQFPEERIRASLSSDGISIALLLDHFQMSAHGFEHLTISEMEVDLDLKTGARDLRIELEGVWTAGAFAVTDLSLDIAYSGDKDDGLQAVLTGHVEIEHDTHDPIVIEISAVHQGRDMGWQLEGSGKFPGDCLPVGQALSNLMGKLGIYLPDAINALELSSIALGFDTRTRDAHLSLELGFDLHDGKPLPLHTALRLEHPEGEPSRTSMTASLELADMEFDVVFLFSDGTTNLVGQYRNLTGEKMYLGKLVRAASPATAEMVGMSGEHSGPSVTLNDVLLIAQSGDKNAADAARKTTRFLVALDADFGIDLSGLGNLPLIGSALPADQGLSIGVEPIVASRPPPDLAAVETILPPNRPFLPETIDFKYKFVTTIKVAGLSEKLALGDPPPAETHTSRLDTPRIAPSLPDTETPSDKIHWIELNRHFGPLAIDRVGLGLLPHGKLAARIDAGLAVGPLTISLEGLGANIDINTHDVRFDLDGIGLELKQEALVVSGEFLRLGDAFVGRAMVEMETLSLGALGAYRKLEDGHPSFFAYAFLDYPLGGPPFFFVEGLALGFGYNRRLIIPEIQQLSDFPLISEVVNPGSRKGGLRAEMKALRRYLPAELDQYFLAIGIKFNSFKVMDGFALLCVSFGNHLEFDLIGETILQLPPPAEGEESPVTLAKLIIPFSARYMPDEGFLAVDAEIAPGSFVYCPEVKLDGSMAFYSWFKGPHGGDFVFTMGGYHPDFFVPAHYPQQDRLRLLGFHWDVDSHFTVKGGLYYAMTPAAAMAGGMLDAQFHAGPLRAWFILGLDLLIQWQPYHYTAHAHVEIGASLTIDVPFVGSLRVSISANADLELCGPELSGKAHVHTSVMGVSVNFDVSFERTKKGDPPKISWAEFERAFLPKPQDVCSISVTAGLLRTVQNDGLEIWVINPKEFALSTGSLIPSDTFDFGGTKLEVAYPIGAPAFGTGPMRHRLGPGDARHKIHVTRDNGRGEYMDFDHHFDAAPARSTFPTALWGQSHDPRASINSGTVDAIGGCNLVPAKPPKPGTSSRIEREVLDYAVTVRDLKEEETSTARIIAAPPTPGWRADMAASLVDAETQDRRAAMLDLLKIQRSEITASARLVQDFCLAPQSVSSGDRK